MNALTSPIKADLCTTTAPLIITAAPHALRSDVVHLTVPQGATLAELIEMVQPDPAAWPHMRVWIAGHYIEPQFYARIRPKAGQSVHIQAWVGKGVVGSLLSIVLTLVAPWAGGLIAGAVGLTGTALTIGSNLIAAGITLIGSMAIQSLVAPPQQEANAATVRPGLQGSRNQLRPGGAIPLILGKHHTVPDLAAEPYTENVGADVYLRQIFVVGYGPLKITDIKIGETPIDRFSDVEIEVREGYDTDLPVTLFPQVAFQDPLSIAVQLNTWSSRFTADDCDEIFVDIEWPRGLMWFGGDGTKYYRRHLIEIQYRPAAGGAWVSAATININEKRLATIRRTRRIKVTRGQYEVQVRRIADPEYPLADDGITYPDDRFVQDVSWTALRGIRNENPIQTAKPLAVIALRIRATEQLNGIVDQLNCVASSVAPDWAGSAWVTRETANVGSLYRHLLQGPAIRRPLADNRLDLTRIQELAERTRALGLEINTVIAQSEDMFSLLKRALAVGRAGFTMRDGKYSVVIDQPQTVPVQAFTPRNVISSSFERVFTEMPHALRVTFISQEADYSEDEVVVYADGYSRANATKFETLPMWGVTSPEQAYRAGRYHFASVKLRPEVYEITTDVEGLVCYRGDMVRLAHDALLVGLAQGRIVARTLDGSNNVVAVELDQDCAFQSGKTYGVQIRRPTADREIVREVTAAPGVTRVLTFPVPIPAASACQIGDLVLFGEAGKESLDCTVASIMREDDYVCRLQLVPHAPDIHDETGPIPEYDPVITVPVEQRRPAPPVIISVETGTEALERIRGRIEPRVLVAVRLNPGRAQPPIARIEAQWQLANVEDWRGEGLEIESLSRFGIRDLDELDEVNIRVRAVSEFGRVSDWVYENGVVVLGITEPPANVQNFRITANGSQGRLSWDAVPGLDISHYAIRWSKQTTGVTWANSTVLVARALGTSAVVPFRAGTYLIRAYDTGGRVSVVPAQVLTDLDRVNGFNAVATNTQHPTFSGTMIDVVLDGGLGGIRLSGVEPFGTGRYDFTAPIDLGSVYTSRVTADIKIATANLVTDVFARTDWFGVEDYFGLPTGETTDVQLQVSISRSAPASNTWGPWQDFEVGDYTAQSFRFRLVLTSTEAGMTPVVQEAAVTVDMPDRVHSLIYAAPAAGGTVNFTPAFQARPTIGITIQGGASGDRITYTATRTDIFVRVFNSAGTGVARTVEIIARGYGET